MCYCRQSKAGAWLLRNCPLQADRGSWSHNVQVHGAYKHRHIPWEVPSPPSVSPVPVPIPNPPLCPSPSPVPVLSPPSWRPPVAADVPPSDNPTPRHSSVGFGKGSSTSNVYYDLLGSELRTRVHQLANLAVQVQLQVSDRRQVQMFPIEAHLQSTAPISTWLFTSLYRW